MRLQWVIFLSLVVLSDAAWERILTTSFGLTIKSWTRPRDTDPTINDLLSCQKACYALDVTYMDYKPTPFECRCYINGIGLGILIDPVNTQVYRRAPCPVNQYEVDMACVDCPGSNLRGSTGAVGIGQCACNNGYYNNQAVAVVNGASQICLECPNPYQLIDVIDRTINSTGINGPSDCVCTKNWYNRGKVYINWNSDTWICEPCDYGFFTEFPNAKSIDECLCPENKFHDYWTWDGRNQHACRSCGDNAVSAQNSSSYTGCQCSDTAQCSHNCAPKLIDESNSYSTYRWIVCEPCLAGEYYDSVSNTCQACASGYVSEAGQTQCSLCAVGKQYSENNLCVDCLMGKYKDVQTSGPCLDCLEGFWTTRVGLTNCDTCNVGYRWRAVYVNSQYMGYYSCLACPINQYKNTIGTGTCTTCDNGKYSNTAGSTACTTCGAVTEDKCNCNQGYTFIKTSNACIACDPGTYKDTSGSGSCSFCAVGSYCTSQACTQCTLCGNFATTFTTEPITGSSSQTDCKCNAGYSGPSSACVACPAGKYKELVSQSTCVDCVAGKYKDTSGSGSCTSCAMGSYCSGSGCAVCTLCGNFATTFTYAKGYITGSSSKTDCICDSGYSGSYIACVACPAGKYKILYASSSCTECPGGKYSAAVAATSSVTCTLCDAGTYCISSTSGCAVCTSCGDGATTYFGSVIIGSQSSSDCKCIAGYGGTAPNGCTACGAGKYKTTILNQACTNCAAGTYSETIAATSSSLCKNCVIGKYCASDGCSTCSNCQDHATTDDTGANAADNCKCLAGYYKEDVFTLLCLECPAGKYTSSKGKTVCSSCGLGTYSSAVATACLDCLVGTYASSMDSDQCKPCEAGKYNTLPGQTAPCNLSCGDGEKVDLSSLSCKDCDVGEYGTGGVCTTCQSLSTTLQPKSTKNSDCLCLAGAQKTSASSCSSCVAGTFKASTGTGACVACPTGISGTGASACTLCAAGKYKASASSCSSCAAGTFKAVAGDQACASCVDGISLEGATSCTQCGEGKFRSGASTCSTCPAGSWSQAGSLSVYACFCNRGYTGNAGAACTACAAGTYKDTRGWGECTACRAGSWSSATAATSAYDCVCNAGYGVLEGACVQCAGGFEKYGTGNEPCTGCETSMFRPPGYHTDNCQTCPSSSYGLNDGRPRTFCICWEGYSHTVSPQNTDYHMCVECAAGKYGKIDKAGTSWNTSAWCEVCPAGKKTSATGKSVCDNCNVGTYSAPGATACQLCPTGKTNTKTGSATCSCDAGYGFDALDATCKACVPGKFKDGSNPEAPCSNCPAGKSNLKTNSTVCDVAARGYTMLNGVAMPCGVGYYQPEIGGNQCVKCPTGSTSSAGAEALASCQCTVQGYTLNQVSSDPYCVCAPGFAKVEQPVMVNNVSVITFSCNPCNAGFFGVDGVCKICAEGYSSKAGAAACYPCPTGTRGTAAGCLECASGQFQNASGQTSCVACRAGSYSANSGAPNCTACAPGRFANASGQSACLECRAGAFSAAEGSKLCSACAVGEYQNDTASSACRRCPAGSFSATLGAAQCAACDAGTYQNATGQSVCVSCRVGTAQKGLGASACDACAPGDYQAEPNAKSCRACGNGTYSQGGASICAECAAGKFQNASQQTACRICQAGTYSLPRAGACSPCAPGSYQNASGMSACTACPGGTWMSESGASACAKCPAGKASAEIGAGFDSCVPCAPNTASDAGGSRCVDCPPGTVSDNRSCVPCAAGTFGPRQGECQPCPNGTYSQMPGATACASCGEGAIVARRVENATWNVGCRHVCGQGEYSGNASGGYGCFPCPLHTAQPAARHSSTACADCGPGRETKTQGSAACVCARGHGGAACKPCAPYWYKDWVGEGECVVCREADDAVPSRMTPSKCPCAVGFYDSGEGPQLGCLQCPSGSYTADIGSTSVAECTVCLRNHMTTTCDGFPYCVCKDGFQDVGYACETCSGCRCGQADCVCLSSDTEPAHATWALILAVLGLLAYLLV